MPCLPRVALVVLALAGGTSAAAAQATQQASSPVKHKPNNYGSPLGTIMSSHLWTEVPQAQDFVRDSRPAPKALDYTPLTSQLGKDPDRPKPRDAANVLALQAELEQSITNNGARAKGLRPAPSPRKHARQAADTR